MLVSKKPLNESNSNALMNQNLIERSESVNSNIWVSMLTINYLENIFRASLQKSLISL